MVLLCGRPSHWNTFERLESRTQSTRRRPVHAPDTSLLSHVQDLRRGAPGYLLSVEQVVPIRGASRIDASSTALLPRRSFVSNHPQVKQHPALVVAVAPSQPQVTLLQAR